MFEHKYLGFFEILERVGNQAYKLELSAKQCLHLVFHILLREKNIIRKKVVDQKIADQLEFKKKKQLEQEDDSIIDSTVFGKETVDS